MSGLAELHVPVMLAEAVALLAPALEAPPTDLAVEGCVLVDCTLGLGGHAYALLAACPQAQLIGLDRDPQALNLARERLAEIVREGLQLPRKRRKSRPTRASQVRRRASPRGFRWSSSCSSGERST